MKKMKTKIISVLALAVIFSLTFSQVLFADDIDEEIDGLNLQIQNQKQALESIRAKQQEYQRNIEDKIKDRISLSNQLSILENRMAKAELDIETTNIEIDKVSLEIRKLELDNENLDNKIEDKKQHIANLLKLAYKQDQISTLEMLLMNESLSDFLNSARYLSDANKEISDSVDDLQLDKEELEKSRLALEKKGTELSALKTKLEDNKENLAYEQENKSYILEETRSSEKQYQALLQQAKREQQQAEAEIANAEQMIRKKMSEKDRNKLNDGNNTISWPVPQNVITSGFHDSSYPYKNIIGEHPAVDIRARQGTTITAAADGYVAKVKFDGNSNYAYIMIIHGDGLSTVYGHVSSVFITADQYVSKGQAIGKTGGTPGTIGSGRFSSGPHLHFEVRLNGLPVDPEKYLP